MSESSEQQAVVVQEPAGLTGWLRVIDRMITEKVPPELLTRVFELQQKAEAEMARKEFVASFAAFKAEAPSAIGRTGHVTYQSAKGPVDYDHVELDVAAEQLTPILSRHGLAHSWKLDQDDKGLITVSCLLEHVAGHSRCETLRAGADTSGSKNAVQGIASTVYYLERYTFLAVLGIAQAGADKDAAGEPEYLTVEQQAEIENLLARAHSDRARFLKWAGVESVEKILRTNFGKVVDMLERAARKVEAK
jgi:hypothetical protein